MEKNVLKKFEKFTLLKKRLWHWCFPVNFTKLLRSPSLQNTSGRLLLQEVALKSVDLIAFVMLSWYLLETSEVIEWSSKCHCTKNEVLHSGFFYYLCSA